MSWTNNVSERGAKAAKRHQAVSNSRPPVNGLDALSNGFAACLPTWSTILIWLICR